MTWVKVDDGWWAHPKIIGLSLPARGLWITAASWCGMYDNGGLVPKFMVKRLGGAPRFVKELLASGLWTETDPSSDPKSDQVLYQFHDWDFYQPTGKSAGSDSSQDDGTEDATRARPLAPGSGTGEVNSNDKLNSIDPYAEAYRKLTGQTDLSLDPSQWSPRQQEAIIRLRSWANSQPTNVDGVQVLTAELKALAQNDWLLGQPIHVWATRVGTGKRTKLTDQDRDGERRRLGSLRSTAKAMASQGEPGAAEEVRRLTDKIQALRTA